MRGTVPCTRQGHSLEFCHGESTCADPRGTRCPAHHRCG
ncbi:hypothetical protein FND50_14705 [Rhodococcus sp. WB9]|nr:hypothetical protein FND50_14705 [Rhodococcus sp. WB9]